MLYDITDEYAAHERQNFFREDKFTQKEITFQMIMKLLVDLYMKISILALNILILIMEMNLIF